MKKQILIIRGGDTFSTKKEYLDFLKNFKIDIKRYASDKSDWKPWLRRKLGEKYEVIIPTMPNPTNAQYEEWSIWFEKILGSLNKKIILIGHSLGGAFLAKYLSEHKITKTIEAVFLVAAVFDKDSEGYSLASFKLPKKLDLQTKKIFLYHSKDDPVVPFSDLSKFQKALPDAESRILNGKKHINQEEFLELLLDILKLTP